MKDMYDFYIPLKYKYSSDALINIELYSYLKSHNDDYEGLARKTNSNVADVIAYPGWFVINDIFYFFKSNGVFNELLISEIMKEFRVKCALFELAMYRGKIGIISENIRNSGSKYLYYNQLFRNAELEDFKHFSCYEEIYNSLSRLLVADFFTGQLDRETYNLLFEKTITDTFLAPLTDNGLAFSENKHTLSTCFRNLCFPRNSKELYDSERDTLNLILENSEFRYYLTKCLDIDINGIINRVLCKYDLLLSDGNRHALNGYFDSKKEIIESSLELSLKM